MNAIERAESNTALYRQATDAASICKDIVVKTACNIQGRKYVKIEGWQAIAVAHGCMLSARDVQRVEGGWLAIGEVRRMDTGATIANAEGYVGKDEVWGKRPEYAARAMAQTRAMSRAARSAFAHVVVMMDAGLETTPAEEVPEEGFPQRAAVTMPKAKSATIEQPALPAPPEHTTDAEKPGSDILGDCTQAVVLVEKVVMKEGKKKNGQPYILFSLVSGNERYGTFHHSIGMLAQSMKDKRATVWFVQKEQGKELVWLEECNA